MINLIIRKNGGCTTQSIRQKDSRLILDFGCNNDFLYNNNDDKFDNTKKWWMHNPDAILENETHKLL